MMRIAKELLLRTKFMPQCGLQLGDLVAAVGYPTLKDLANSLQKAI